MTQKTLIKSAQVVATMNPDRQELADCDILIEDGKIVAIGSDLGPCENTINASGCVVTPGLVNTHHHLFQTLLRCVPKGQDALLFG